MDLDAAPSTPTKRSRRSGSSDQLERPGSAAAGLSSVTPLESGDGGDSANGGLSLDFMNQAIQMRGYLDAVASHHLGGAHLPTISDGSPPPTMVPPSISQSVVGIPDQSRKCLLCPYDGNSYQDLLYHTVQHIRADPVLSLRYGSADSMNLLLASLMGGSGAGLSGGIMDLSGLSQV